ncbi:MAG: hypothetical protein J3R72DRAFT_203424 [Linnemannia gamsii]|nr:MAG: hypothetical protein J3R72DRAFT_203424 [Linnemannia gamsii]
MAATRHFNKERQKKLEAGKPPPPDIIWRKSSTRQCREALWKVVEKPGEEEERSLQTVEKWTACHIYRGLVPTSLAKEWGKVFKDSPDSVAQHVSRSFCRYVEMEAREQLWKPRCATTVDWEKDNHITTSMKQTRTSQGQREGWRQIYGRKLREGECLCGRAIIEHNREQCPGEQRDTRVADQAVIDTLLGLRRKDIMERRGNMAIKDLEVDET